MTLTLIFELSAAPHLPFGLRDQNSEKPNSSEGGRLGPADLGGSENKDLILKSLSSRID